MASISWASFVNLTVDGQRPLGFTLVVNILIDRLPASAGLALVNLTVDGQSSLGFTLVVNILIDRLPASAGLALINLTVDGQRPLDLSSSTNSSSSDGQRDLAGLSFVNDFLVI